MSEPADWAIDVGHSRIKWARCVDGELDLRTIGSCRNDDPHALLSLIKQKGIEHLVWSPQSHGELIRHLRHEFEAHKVSCRTISTGAINLPVAAAYSELGSDRWLALQWPWSRRRQAFCVIDCGTAVTIDAVDADGQHLGGWIMAGLPTLTRGLAQTAPNLPAPDMLAPIKSDAATDSASAIAAGLMLQLQGGVCQALAQIKQRLGASFDCWLTGGDADRLAGLIDQPSQHDPHLVLRGLALAAARTPAQAQIQAQTGDKT